jgi:hypothetical protein
MLLLLLLVAMLMIPAVTISEDYICVGRGLPWSDHHRVEMPTICMCLSQEQGYVVNCPYDPTYPDPCEVRWCSSTNCCHTKPNPN